MACSPMGFLGPGTFIRKCYQIGHIVQTTKPYILQTLLRSNLKNRWSFSTKKITMVCKKSLEYTTKPYICQTFKPEYMVCLLPIPIIVLRSLFHIPAQES